MPPNTPQRNAASADSSPATRPAGTTGAGPARAEPPADAAALPPAPAASLFQVVNAVFWSFLGIRRNAAWRRDAVTIRPHQVIIIGVAMAALLVAGLVLLVRLILRG